MTPAGVYAQPRPPPNVVMEARTRLFAGDAAARKKDWTTALDQYAQSQGAVPSVQALGGMANASYQLQFYPDAYDHYDSLLKTFGAKLTRAQRTEAETRLQQLGQKTGLLAIKVNEPGAFLTIDDKRVGTAPFLAPIRLSVGAHTVGVTKEGFVPLSLTQEILAGQTSVADLVLVVASSKARLMVREKTGQAVRVIVDGVDVGGAPWEGELEAGAHEVMVRSSALAASPQTIELLKGGRGVLEFVATAAVARLELKTSDGQGYIYLDDQLKGEGAFAADVPVGPHTIDVKREGFVPFRKVVTLADKQKYAEVVTLVRPQTEQSGTDLEGERLYQGVYGGFGLVGVTGAGGMKSSLETGCSTLGASSCSTPDPLGGGLFGYLGYTWNPVGFELFLAGMADSTTQRAHFDGTGPNPIASLPAREESFVFGRFGGMGAVRVRASVQTRMLRLSLAAGFGLSYKYMVMKREASTADGLRSADVQSGVNYLSPGISVEVAAHLRVGRSAAISLGVMLWAENAGTDAKVGRRDDQLLAAPGREPQPLWTPDYTFARNAQYFIGPYLGMQFGP